MNTHARNARLCLGGAVICVLFLIETFVAHQSRPNAASLYAWSVLGAVAAILLVLAAYLQLRAKKEDAAAQPSAAGANDGD